MCVTSVTSLTDLGVAGTGCQQRLSAKDRSRAEEARVMDVLRSEGLIQVGPAVCKLSRGL